MEMITLKRYSDLFISIEELFVDKGAPPRHLAYRIMDFIFCIATYVIRGAVLARLTNVKTGDVLHTVHILCAAWGLSEVEVLLRAANGRPTAVTGLRPPGRN